MPGSVTANSGKPAQSFATWAAMSPEKNRKTLARLLDACLQMGMNQAGADDSGAGCRAQDLVLG